MSTTAIAQEVPPQRERKQVSELLAQRGYELTWPRVSQHPAGGFQRPQRLEIRVFTDWAGESTLLIDVLAGEL